MKKKIIVFTLLGLISFSILSKPKEEFIEDVVLPSKPVSVAIKSNTNKSNILVENEGIKRKLIKDKLIEEFDKTLDLSYVEATQNEVVLCEPTQRIDCHPRCVIDEEFTSCGVAYQYRDICLNIDDIGCNDYYLTGHLAVDENGYCITPRRNCKNGTDRDLTEEELLSSRELNHFLTEEDEREFIDLIFNQHHHYVNMYELQKKLFIIHGESFIDCVLNKHDDEFLKNINLNDLDSILSFKDIGSICAKEIRDNNPIL